MCVPVHACACASVCTCVYIITVQKVINSCGINYIFSMNKMEYYVLRETAPSR